MAKRRRRKLTDEDIERAFVNIRRGRSLRSIARHYRVHHSSLSERLVKLFGPNYRKPDRTAEILSEYANSADPRLSEAAHQFLSDYNPTTDTANFYSTRRERDLTIRATTYTFNAETFRAARGGVSCKIA